MALALALTFYAVVVAAATWPLAPHATTHISAVAGPLELDTLRTVWVLAHETRALTTSPLTLLAAGIYYPEPRTLFLGTTGFGLLPYFAPTFLVTHNPALAVNVAFLTCACLTAWTVHVVVHRWTASHAAGLVGGISFLASGTSLFGFAASAPEFSPLQYLPLVVALAAQPIASPWLLGALVALQGLTDPIYVAPVIAMPLVALTIWRGIHPGNRVVSRQLAAALIVAGLALLPVYAGYADVAAHIEGLPAHTVWRSDGARATAAIRALPLATAARMYCSWLWLANPVPLLALALVAIGGTAAWRYRDAAPATPRHAWIHASLWLAIGLLAPALARLSTLEVFRGWERPAIVAVPACALLAGLAFAELAHRLGSSPAPRWCRAALTAVTLAALLVLPPGPGHHGLLGALGTYPIVAPPARGPIVEVLRRMPGPVLEVSDDGPSANARAMYRAIFHEQPILNGYSSYFRAEFSDCMALARRLPDPKVVPILQRAAGLVSVVVHLDELAPQRRTAWEHLKDTSGLRLVTRDGDALLFATRQGLVR